MTASTATLRRSGAVLRRLVVFAALVSLALAGVSSAAEGPSTAAESTAATQEPDGADGVDQGSTTTSEPESLDEVVDQQPATTTTTTPATQPEHRDEAEDEQPTTTSQPGSFEEVVDQEPPTTTTPVTPVSDLPARPGPSPQVRESLIPFGSIALALLVLSAVGVVSYTLLRSRPVTPEPHRSAGSVRPSWTADTEVQRSVRAPAPAPAPAPVDPSTSDFLVGLGEALMDAGASVGHVESALRTVARANGVEDVGVIVLPTALIVSVPEGADVVSGIGAPGRTALRLDQIDDVLQLVREAESGAIGASEGERRLADIRHASAPYSPGLMLGGHICATAGVAAILHGTWVEIVAAAFLGVVVGAFRLWSRRFSSSHQSFVVLIAATVVSASVFALTRVVDDLLTFPVLISPLITFLPGGLLTIAVLELATGQIVSGASRLASGGLQLILLALGIVAGSQLVGVPTRRLAVENGETIAVVTPWVGVALFGIGLVWFYGARSSARLWILVVMYVAYAGQVIGGLFFGSALSAFFGALAMTPIAVLAARRPNAPSPLVTFLPGFWVLVPGGLGLDGVTRLFGVGGDDATEVFVTTATSMIGVSLGILLGLLLVAGDPERPWSETRKVAH